MALRDPVMYRIRHSHHFRTGDDWCVYPTYDWAHGQSDAIEGVTHSICTLEFDTHRPLYDWYLEHLPLPGDKPKQIEFARLEFTHIITSKRRLAKLVNDGTVDGWDDPRMPTLRGLRRRGYPAAAIRAFCTEIGTTRTNSRQSIEALESYVRRELNSIAQRRMAVLHPLRLVIDNWPTDVAGIPVVEYFDVANNPENPADGTRQVAFSGELWIEAEDFAEVPPPKFFRLTVGREVRLRGAYLVTATGHREGRRRRGRCRARHLRPGHPRRRRPRRPQGEVDDALGVRRRTPPTSPSGCTGGCSPPRCPARPPARRWTT